MQKALQVQLNTYVEPKNKSEFTQKLCKKVKGQKFEGVT